MPANSPHARLAAVMVGGAILFSAASATAQGAAPVPPDAPSPAPPPPTSDTPSPSPDAPAPTPVIIQLQPTPAPAASAPPEPPWWRRPARPAHPARMPLAVVAPVVGGLGAILLGASGVTWLVAYGEARDLEEECPNHRCVEGTPGGDTYEEVRRLANTSAVLLGVSIPMMAGGIVMGAIAGGLRGESRGVEVAIGVSPSGLSLGGRF
ncbi:MAG: hypothetical protein R3B72_47900 [Polyangiaceae bacterium]